MTGSSAKTIKKILLVGNPNVGKSVIFARLTGKYVIVSNYPGTTVEISKGNFKIGDQLYEIIDTPGANTLVPQSEDEKVTRDMIILENPDIIIQIGDAKNIRRTLNLTLQLAEFKIPMLLNLNMIDECHSRGIEIDVETIEKTFGIPVNTTIAPMGVGIGDLTRLICNASVPVIPFEFNLRILEEIVAILTPNFPAALTIEWLMNTSSADVRSIESILSCSTLNEINNIIEKYQHYNSVSLAVYFTQARNRFLDDWVPKIKTQNRIVKKGRSNYHLYPSLLILIFFGVVLHFTNYLLPLFGMAGPFDLLSEVIYKHLLPWIYGFSKAGKSDLIGLLFTPAGGNGLLIGDFGLLHPGITMLLCYILPPVLPFFIALKKVSRFSSDFDRYARKRVSGIGIILIILSITYVFVGKFGAQVLVGFLETVVFGHIINPFFHWLFVNIIPLKIVSDMLVGDYGLVTMGLTYSIAIVLPVVWTFFIAFGFLEDSGYLPRLAVLVNRIFRFMGLSGKAVLPMVLGLGCDTMATMTARILNSRKERLIATILLALGIPCSAQLGVILGIFSGVSLSIILVVAVVVAAQLLLVGFLAGKILRGEKSDFVMEIPPIRYPVWKNIFIKTKYRVVWFLKEAVPLFLLGTFVLFVFDKLHVVKLIIEWSQPVVKKFLGLPPQTAQVFVMGFLRRDFGAAGLFDLVNKGLLNGNQIAVALIVLTLFVPCIANFFVIIKEQGLNKALAIVGFIIPFAILTGGVVHFIFNVLNIHL